MFLRLHDSVLFLSVACSTPLHTISARGLFPVRGSFRVHFENRWGTVVIEKRKKKEREKRNIQSTVKHVDSWSFLTFRLRDHSRSGNYLSAYFGINCRLGSFSGLYLAKDQHGFKDL